MKEFLKAKDLSYVYQAKNGEIEALKNINFDMYKGEFISIVGPSGCGKSTLLSIISGLLTPTSGSIYLNGEKITKINPKIAYMQQSDYLLSWLTIEKNITLGLKIQKKLTKQNKEYALNLADKYGLFDFKQSLPSQLSGGMRQRAALIRTLAVKPSILLLDEAFSALDFQTRLQVTNDVSKILKAESKSILMVTHDIPESITMSDKVIVLTKRPGTIKSIHKLEFDDCTSPLKRRKHQKFSEYYNTIWGELVE